MKPGTFATVIGHTPFGTRKRTHHFELGERVWIVEEVHGFETSMVWARRPTWDVTGPAYCHVPVCDLAYDLRAMAATATQPDTTAPWPPPEAWQNKKYWLEDETDKVLKFQGNKVLFDGHWRKIRTDDRGKFVDIRNMGKFYIRTLEGDQDA